MDGIYGFGYSAVDDKNKQVIRIERKAHVVRNAKVDEKDTLADCFLKWIKSDRPQLIKTPGNKGNTPANKEATTEEQNHKVPDTHTKDSKETLLCCFNSCTSTKIEPDQNGKQKQTTKSTTDNATTTNEVNTEPSQKPSNGPQENSMIQSSESKPIENGEQKQKTHDKAATNEVLRGTRSPEFILSVAGGASNFVLKRRFVLILLGEQNFLAVCFFNDLFCLQITFSAVFINNIQFQTNLQIFALANIRKHSQIFA